VTEVRFFNERGRDRFGEYQDIKRRRPEQAAAIRDAISLIVADPDKAERDYSIRPSGARTASASRSASSDGWVVLLPKLAGLLIGLEVLTEQRTQMLFGGV
jgi:hypothetical protein